MRTSIEALFDAMISGGWASRQSGDVESPTGHFALIMINKREICDVLDAFRDTTDMYGVPTAFQMEGIFLVATTSDGTIHVEQYRSTRQAEKIYAELEQEFAQWTGEE